MSINFYTSKDNKEPIAAIDTKTLREIAPVYNITGTYNPDGYYFTGTMGDMRNLIHHLAGYQTIPEYVKIFNNSQYAPYLIVGSPVSGKIFNANDSGDGINFGISDIFNGIPISIVFEPATNANQRKDRWCGYDVFYYILIFILVTFALFFIYYGGCMITKSFRDR